MYSLQLRSISVKDFSFKTHCFVCASHIPEDYARSQQRLPPYERNLVHQVTKIGMKDTILKLAEMRGDDFASGVINRILPITDMVAAGCQYHDCCFKKTVPS